MSEKSCNKCIHGKMIVSSSTSRCEDCILGSNFLKSSTPIRIIRPALHDDRARIKVHEAPDQKDSRTVEMIASGYEWTCPECDTLHTHFEVTEDAYCDHCKLTFETDEIYHAIG